MGNETRIHLLARVARSLSAPAAPLDAARPTSILSLSSAAYGSRPPEDATVPTGFDPVAIALFEAMVEAAYLVARSDGVFDEQERRAFEQLVVTACSGMVTTAQIHALVGDLEDQLVEDGVGRRVQVIASGVTKREHALEVLRMASLLAQVSDPVSAVERATLDQIAAACALDRPDVEAALADVRAALASASGP